MKAIKLSLVFLLLIAAVGCGDDDEGPVEADFQLRADIDGQTIDQGFVFAQMTSMGRYIAITSSGSVGGGDAITVGIGSLDETEPILAEGTFSTIDSNTSIGYVVGGETSYQTFDTEASGTVNITNLDTTNKTISGTFEGTLKNLATGETVSLTNGEFNEISYEEQ